MWRTPKTCRWTVALVSHTLLWLWLLLPSSAEAQDECSSSYGRAASSHHHHNHNHHNRMPEEKEESSPFLIVRCCTVAFLIRTGDFGQWSIVRACVRACLLVGRNLMMVKNSGLLCMCHVMSPSNPSFIHHPSLTLSFSL